MSRALLVWGLLCAVASAGEANWVRYPAISPDGTRIVFSYRGDLWVQGTDGGAARPLTTHVGYERSAVWSPDGTQVAFASDRHGNFDVFVVAAAGGKARRLTFHSAGDVPTCFSSDGQRVHFNSIRQDDPRASIATVWMAEFYSVAVAGGPPRQEMTTFAGNARFAPDGARLAYEDFKGWENYWRKHHTSAVTRDIWTYDPATKKHAKLTAFAGEDRNPVWSPDGATLFYLSEKSGNFNVWSRPAAPGGAPQQVTRHAPHPVRFLTAAKDGTLCYGYNGGVYVGRPGGEFRRVRIDVAAGDRMNARRRETFRDGASEFALAPSEEEVAFVVRGEVFVASVKHGTTRRITHTPQQERSVAWAPDGKALYYATERGASWDVYRCTLARDGEERFHRATLLKEEPVVATEAEEFEPFVAPDGKSLAYLHDRDEIRVFDLAARTSRVVVPAARNYSYSDGDVRFRWSPDSKWLVCEFLPVKSYIADIAAVAAATGERLNLTLSGYDEYLPRWSRDGTAILYSSNRFGRRSHGSWGADEDIFAVDLTRAAHDRARLSVEDFELLEEQEKKKEEEKDDKKKDGDDKKKKDDKEEQKPVDPVVIEAENRLERTRRLTLHSAPLGAFDLSPDGETLVYAARVDGKWGLYHHKIRKSETKRVMSLGDRRPGEIVFDQEGEAVFLRRGDGGIVKVPVPDGEPKPVGYAAEMEIDAPAERAYIFEHAWRQAAAKFYNPSLHGADWPALKANYARFLGEIDNNHDFAELLSELLGELNASHTGAGYRIPRDGADETAALGLLFDPRHPGDGLKVMEVLLGGPADRADSKLGPGAVVTHIDGVALAGAVNPWAQLNRKAGKRVLLRFRTAAGAEADEVLKPIAIRAEFNLRYQRWVRQRRALTEEWSKGRVGYVHVRGMNDRSFRHLFQEALGRHAAKDALIVDTRFNGGGWLHDDLLKFLGGRRYLTYQPRGKERGSVGGEPLHRWARPVAVVMSEGNYSDAHVFPYAFQAVGMGKLVGTPVAGTGTAVWWERQIDPTLTFGIPQVGMVTNDGKYLENLDLKPDVHVVNGPEERARGEDPQLRRAVAVLLEELK